MSNFMNKRPSTASATFSQTGQPMSFASHFSSFAALPSLSISILSIPVLSIIVVILLPILAA